MGKNAEVNNHIKTIWETYQDIHYNILQPMIVNKEKQKEDRVQDEKVFLYKPYGILSKSSKSKMSEPTFIQDEVNNLEKYIYLLQLPVKMTLFYLSPHYKFF